ncbi:MAG: T9SS type A sorting domain-containing protein [Chitinophagaceae bacterium]|nr:T9SS type A sorting domain-containing protein [Chitinophagaceae bacterium]
MKTISITLLGILFSWYAHAQLWRVGAVVTTQRDASLKITYQDSTCYYYDSSGRGSNKMADTILFTTSDRYSLQQGSMVKFGDVWAQKFDQQDRITSLVTLNNSSADTVSEDFYIYSPGGSRLLYSKEYTKYAGPNQPIYWAWDSYSYTFNTQGKLERLIYRQQWPSYPTLTTYTTIYTYDSSGFLINDSTSYNSLPSQGKYTRSEYENDLNGDSVITRHYTWDEVDTVYRLSLAKAYTYDTARRVIVDSNIYGATNGAVHWYTYHPNGDLYRDSFFTTISLGVSTYEYNTHDKIAKITTEEVYNSYKNTITKVYYYQHYWPKSVAGLDQLQADITLYPIPASGTLHLKGQFKEPGQLRMSITDITGRSLKQYTLHTGAELNVQLHIEDLAPGNYVMNFEQSGHTVSKKFVVQ